MDLRIRRSDLWAGHFGAGYGLRSRRLTLVGRVEEYRPYFENYTVDASILKMRTKRIRLACDGLFVSQIIQALFEESWVTHVISIF